MRVDLFRLTPAHVYYCEYVFEPNTRRPQQMVYLSIYSAIKSECGVFALDPNSWSTHDDTRDSG